MDLMMGHHYTDIEDTENPDGGLPKEHYQGLSTNFLILITYKMQHVK